MTDKPKSNNQRPQGVSIPSEPTVFIKITDFERTRLPLPPYLVAHVQILAEYRGLPGWYTLTMPETEWIPVEMVQKICEVFRQVL